MRRLNLFKGMKANAFPLDLFSTLVNAGDQCHFAAVLNYAPGKG